MPDIFVSHAREDRPRAEALVRALSERGWSVWWDGDIRIGEPFPRAIEEQLDSAKCVVVLWSEHSVQSEWVRNEAAEGLRRNVLVPVRLDDAKLPLEFRRLNTGRYERPEPVLRAIEALVDGRPRTSRMSRRAFSGLAAMLAIVATLAVLLTGRKPSPPVVEIETTAGTFALELRPDVAPNHVRNFIELARSGFYDGTKFHRAIRGVLIQGGDPATRASLAQTWGTGGSGRTLRSEFNDLPHLKGTLSMAHGADANSASSQFFICLGAAPALDGRYTAFGRVREGLDVVERIASGAVDDRDRPLAPVAIVRMRVRD